MRRLFRRFPTATAAGSQIIGWLHIYAAFQPGHVLGTILLSLAAGWWTVTAGLLWGRIFKEGSADGTT